jgi:L,D-transpeptidase ErfK/SrfK
MRGVWLAGLLALAHAGEPAVAATYPLPESGNDLVGEITSTRVGDGETLIDIARLHGLGYNEIVAANPGLDPWLPPVGAEVVLPTRYILPSTPREGIIINLAEMRLYYYPAPRDGEQPEVMTFPIGIGQEGWSTPVGITKVIDKVENPSWTVPQSIRQAHAEAGRPLPAIVAPGPDNPLGNHAMRLGWTSYLIHGTNKTFGVGMRVSHGCIRMYPEDIALLFGSVPLSTPVWIIDQPYKLGRHEGRLFLEAHAPVEDPDRPPADNFSTIIAAIEAVTPHETLTEVRQTAMRIATRQAGMPESVGEIRPPYQGNAMTGWVVQLGAFLDKGNASRLAEQLAGLGAPVTVQARVNDGYCHVLVGPYADEDIAREAMDELRESTGHVGNILPADRHGMLSDCLL